MKLYFNYIYETINFFFFIFPPSIQNFFYGFVLQVLLPKKQKDEVLLLPTFRFYNTSTIITYIQIKQLVHVLVFSSLVVSQKDYQGSIDIYENLGLKFLTNILRPSQRNIPVITQCIGVGRGPTPHLSLSLSLYLSLSHILSSIKKVNFFIFYYYYYYYYYYITLYMLSI